MNLRALVPAFLLLVVASANAACTVETLVPGSSDPERNGDETASGSPSASGSSSTTAPSASSTVGTSNDSAADVSLTVSGDCAPVFRDLVVATNTGTYDSLSIANATSPTQGSLQFSMVSGRKKVALSTGDRTSARDVVNVMAGGMVYTNMCNTAGGCSYDPDTKTWKNDPVKGTIEVESYDPRTGVLEAKLDGVVLQAAGGGGLCKLQGTVRTKRLGR
jgi:hypothetical protein